MITPPAAADIFAYFEPTDMRMSFDGLSGLVRSALGREPTDGSYFLFANRRRDRADRKQRQRSARRAAQTSARYPAGPHAGRQPVMWASLAECR